MAELPTVTKKSYLLRKSEGNTTIRKHIQKIRIHETQKKKKKKPTTKDRDIAKSLYTVQCMQHARAHAHGMGSAPLHATYTSAELKSVRACEPPQWVTASGTSWISSPGCRRWVDGETVEVLHVHCSFLAHAAMSWTRSLDWRFISSITLQWTWLYFNGYFIHFVTLHLTYRNFGADIFWHSWIFHFLIAENVVGDFHVMIFCAAAMSWHTAELAWISPQGVGGVLMGKPFCICTASSRACMHN